MTKDEIGVLLYLETRAVDHGGRVDILKMSQGQIGIAQRWNTEGFIGFGRIVSADQNRFGSCWVELSDAAWDAVAKLRKERAVRGLGDRNYARTSEKAVRS